MHCSPNLPSAFRQITPVDNLAVPFVYALAKPCGSQCCRGLFLAGPMRAGTCWYSEEMDRTWHGGASCKISAVVPIAFYRLIVANGASLGVEMLRIRCFEIAN